MELSIGDWSVHVRRSRAAGALADRYDRSAAGWHRSIGRLGYLGAYRGLFERLVSEGELPILGRQARVLDAGIGSGALSLALAETIGAQFALDGVDLAAGMLEEARARLAAAGLATTLHQRSVEDLPFAAGSFDAVISAHVLEHVADLRGALAELARALRPGAPLVLVLTRPGPATAWLRLRWGAATYSPGEVLAALGAAGLVGLRLYPFRGGVAQRWSCAYLGRAPADR